MLEWMEIIKLDFSNDYKIALNKLSQNSKNYFDLIYSIFGWKLKSKINYLPQF